MDEPQTPVTVSLEDLRKDSVSFDTLEQAFGPSSLGILLVKDLPPEFIPLRHKLLSYASYLANLPEAELEKLSCPSAKYLTGWSRGKETLKSGHYDTLKGSYYVNCAFYQDPSLQRAPADSESDDFTEYTAPNVWPAETQLPGFRATFEELCTLIIDVAVLVARACDRYAGVNVEGYERGYLERVVRGSRTTKARLLHYFPGVLMSPVPLPAAGDDSSVSDPPAPTTISQSTKTTHNNDNDTDTDPADDWCATHIDHGCLTGLTSAMYVDESTTTTTTTVFPDPTASTSTSPSTQPPTLPFPPLPELPGPSSPTSGLYIHSRTNAITKVSIPRTNLAFQTGEALQLVTRGKFRAVPHFVRGAGDGEGGSRDDGGGEGGGRGARIARNTLAVFTQPNLQEIVDVRRGLTFGEFAREVVGRNM